MSRLFPRRRVLCVRPRANATTSQFMLPVVSEWIAALQLHCDVHVVERDFDLDALCSEVQPDFILFEGLHPERPSALRIANIGAHAHLPRAAFLTGDANETMRPLSYQMLEQYGLSTVFSYNLDHQQLMPELAFCEIFSLPVFFDPSIFRDYGLEKTIPVSVFGGHLLPKQYAWRARLVREIPERMPTLIYTHPGYGAEAAHPFPVQGESYARLINQSWFSAADTMRFDAAVRKHLEIPAAGAVLVAPDTPALRDYGFVDMQNCVRGEGSALYDKMAMVARDRDLFHRICRAGHDLVHARYTRQSWRLIPDWYEARRTLQAGEMLRQQGQFGGFRAVPACAGTPAIADCRMADNPVGAVLREARAAIFSGAPLAPVQAALQEVASWIHLAEPWLLLGVAALLQGRAAEAKAAFLRPAQIQHGRHSYHQLAPHLLVCLDPVEMAWLLFTGFLTEDLALVQMVTPQTQGVRHLSLRRVLWLLDGGDLEQVRGRALDARLPDDRLSVHWIGQEDFATWRDLLRRILLAHGRPEAAAALTRQLEPSLA